MNSEVEKISHIVCDQCPSIFQNVDTFTRHKKIFHLRYKCLKCPTMFASKTELCEHQNEVHCRYKCNETNCTYASHSHDFLLKHVRRMHSTKKLSCSILSCEFSTNYKARTMILVHF